MITFVGGVRSGARKRYQRLRGTARSPDTAHGPPHPVPYPTVRFRIPGPVPLPIWTRKPVPLLRHGVSGKLNILSKTSVRIKRDRGTSIPCRCRLCSQDTTCGRDVHKTGATVHRTSSRISFCYGRGGGVRSITVLGSLWFWFRDEGLLRVLEVKGDGRGAGVRGLTLCIGGRLLRR